MALYCGIDLHSNNNWVTVIDEVARLLRSVFSDVARSVHRILRNRNFLSHSRVTRRECERKFLFLSGGERGPGSRNSR